MEAQVAVFSPEGEAQVSVPGSSHHTGERLREGERRWKPDHSQNEKQLVEVVHSATSESLKPGRSCQFLGLMRTTVYNPRQHLLLLWSDLTRRPDLTHCCKSQTEGWILITDQ